MPCYFVFSFLCAEVLSLVQSHLSHFVSVSCAFPFISTMVCSLQYYRVLYDGNCRNFLALVLHEGV